MVEKDKSPARLAVSGKMRSGKDTLSEYLVKRYGFARFAFADRLKDVAVELFGMSASRKDRHLLVGLGRKMCEVDQLVWVNYVLGKIPLRADVVISDVRFRYEYDVLKAFGFSMVRVTVDRDTQVKRVMKCGSAVDISLLDDRSETDLDTAQFDYFVDGISYGSINSGADAIMRRLGRRPLDDNG
ncbi:MAG: hypothetical protein M0R06_16820 [Sphaerochaeta sp.]|nr:hypothetical protein [Sphaerochaeta sp.]